MTDSSYETSSQFWHEFARQLPARLEDIYQTYESLDPALVEVIMQELASILEIRERFSD